ncbi:NUDIX domain-containing protein [Mucilaginibacter sp. RS28]|uniref:NUDIX domain-containing protein n=1 Tax=Mucilaginibacter straminoryzae TaxID=2932774 RepID=A0A9X1X5D1_9SPHI|nr:NUDIX domain-containing protein [Mucilaginibacter straminoryzae]MCJ8208984.1 NUDIX domain-containing protein [Mucilaginibacter straminoryzae]
MQRELPILEMLAKGDEYFLPAVSVDNVIFGFHQDELKVLLLKAKHGNMWALPGGYVFKDEEVDAAAARVLKDRTQLANLFLQQFYVFGSAKRTRLELSQEAFQNIEAELMKSKWLMQRFISVGYYALVEYEKVKPLPDDFSSECSWHDLNNLPQLIFDHREIIEKALLTMRLQLNNQPIGYNLLPREFTLKSLQSLYETILGRKLDRGNFNRKMLGYDVLDKKEKHFTGGAHKAPYLYSFNKQKYFEALRNGLKRDF